MNLTRLDIIKEFQKKDSKGKEKKKGDKLKDIDSFLSEVKFDKKVLDDLESYPDYYASKP